MIEEIDRFGSFCYALKFGIMLMVEVFMGASEVVDKQPRDISRIYK